MASEVFREIIEAETEAENLRKDALIKSKEIIRDAEEKDRIELDTAAKKAQGIASAVIKEKEDEAVKQANAILQSAEEECRKIKSVPEEKIDEAVNLVIGRIVNPYGNS